MKQEKKTVNFLIKTFCYKIKKQKMLTSYMGIVFKKRILDVYKYFACLYVCMYPINELFFLTNPMTR